MSEQSGQIFKYQIETDSDVIIARSRASKLAQEAGFSSMNCQEISIVVSELATNIIKYASPGIIYFEILDGEPASFVIVAEDQGHGIADVENAFEDFHTDKGPIITPKGYIRPFSEGLGCGLPAVRRLMDEVTVDSLPNKGTRIRAVKAKKTF